MSVDSDDIVALKKRIICRVMGLGGIPWQDSLCSWDSSCPVYWAPDDATPLWNIFLCKTQVNKSADDAVHCLSYPDTVNTVEPTIQVLKTLHSFDDADDTKLRYMRYTRIWPACSRDFVIMAFTMSMCDIHQRGWMSEEQFRSYAHPERTYVIVNTSADDICNDRGFGEAVQQEREDDQNVIRSTMHLSVTVVTPMSDDGDSSEICVCVHIEPGGDIPPMVLNTTLGISLPSIMKRLKRCIEG
jgi:hypothetical protein